MKIERRGYRPEKLTFENFIKKHNLTVVVIGIEDYFEATIEHQDGTEYYIAKADGTKIRDLMGEGATEARAIKELAQVASMIHIAIQTRLYIKVPKLRINYEN